MRPLHSEFDHVFGVIRWNLLLHELALWNHTELERYQGSRSQLWEEMTFVNKRGIMKKVLILMHNSPGYWSSLLNRLWKYYATVKVWFVVDIVKLIELAPAMLNFLTTCA